MESAFFSFDLLEAQTVSCFVEVVQAWSGPLLVFLGIVLLEMIEILCQLLEDFFFELALDLTRVGTAGCLEVLGLAIELPTLGGAVFLDVLAGRGCVDEHTLLRLYVLYFGGRHLCGD